MLKAKMWIFRVEEGYTSKFQQGQLDGVVHASYSKWEKYVDGYWTLGSNTIQMFRLKRLPCGELGIITVYAPNNLVDMVNL